MFVDYINTSVIYLNLVMQVTDNIGGVELMGRFT